MKPSSKAKILLVSMLLASVSSVAVAQSTYPTADGISLVPGGALLVPVGTTSAGKTIYGPPTSLNPLQVTGTLSIGGTAANNADNVAAVSTGLGQQQIYPFLWNGSTFDRWYGDKTNGAFVNIKTSVLPTGAALDASLQSILTKLNASIAVTGTFWQATQPISAVSLPLPTGAMASTGGTVGLVAGSAIAGKFGIDQTTPVTTNGIVVAPTSASAAGITPIVSASAEGSHVLKGSPGNLYSLYVTTGATSGYVMTFNATTAPADGAVTPIECVPVFATSTLGLTFGSGPPDVYSTGITAVFSSTGCFTKTVSATAFFKARVM